MSSKVPMKNFVLPFFILFIQSAFGQPDSSKTNKGFGIIDSTIQRRTTQTTINLNTLDGFFGGVPLQQSYEKWYKFIYSHPNMGIDSVNERGAYSSLKGITNQFPFPDSILVKILFEKIIYFDSLTNRDVDSTSNIAFEGVFGKDKIAQKESISFYKKLRKELKKDYKEEAPGSRRFYSFFSNGKNENFMPCMLFQDYSDEFKFYFVMLVYDTSWLKE